VNGGTRASLKEFKQRLSQAKDYDAFSDITVRGEDVFQGVRLALEQRPIVQHGAPVLGSPSTAPSAPPKPLGERESHHSAALDPSGAGQSPEGVAPVAVEARIGLGAAITV